MSKLSRRTFLQTAATATAVGLAAPRAFGANERIRVGVLGCRNRGHQVASNMLGTGQFEIATLCDVDTRMLARGKFELRKKMQNTPKEERDFRKVLEDPDIDAILVASPDHWHACMTILALQAGKHVYCEKPASFCIGEGIDMVAADKAHPNLVTMVGTQQRSGEHFMEARQFIQEGGLGKVGFARAWIVQDREFIKKVPNSAPPEELDYDLWVGPAPWRDYNEELTHYNWHFDRNFGTGEMGNWGAHWLDVARWLCDVGVPDRASGYGGQYVKKDAKTTPDTQTALYHYPEMTLLWEQRIWSKFNVQDKGGAVEIGGGKGSLIINRSGWTFYPMDGEPEQHRGSNLDGAHAENFAASIRGEATPNASMEDGHLSAVLCHLGNVTATLNREVVINPDDLTFVEDDEANALRDRKDRDPWSGVRA